MRIKPAHLTFLLSVFLFAGAPAETPPGEKNADHPLLTAMPPDFGNEVAADPRALDRLFALPAAILRDEPGDAQARRIRAKGWLGISMRQPKKPQSEDPGETAVEILAVFEGSAAQTAGVRPGDRILALDGTAVPESEPGRADLEKFRLIVNAKPPGDSLKLKIRRGDGEIFETDAVLRTRPRSPAIGREHPELEPRASSSLLSEALHREGLLHEFALLAKEMRRTTEDIISPAIRGNQGYNPFRLSEVNYALSHPLQLPALTRELTRPLTEALNGEDNPLAGLLSPALESLDERQGNREAPPQAGGFTDWIEYVLRQIQWAERERAVALAEMEPDELEIILAGARGLLTAKSKGDLSEEERSRNEEELKRFFNAALKVDLGRLLRAGEAVARALDIQFLRKLKKDSSFSIPARPGWTVTGDENMTVIETPQGRVLVGGQGGNTYTEDAVLIIDLGGNDRYLNGAGASRPEKNIHFAVVVDLAGNDVYTADGEYAQGAGLLGGGFLVDLEGDDVYQGGDYAQGVGVFGIGMLADFGGRDEYRAHTVAQGAGFFGVGVLADGSGSDRYLASRFAQGFGFVKGYGALVESAGDDFYQAGGEFPDAREPGKATQSLSQGFGYGLRPVETSIGASGGIGLLVDVEGNDTYIADYFAQGSAYWYALGILEDRAGHDRYLSSRYSQGAGIHYAAGILMDGAGDDNYLADFGVAQGCGHDFGVGWLLDNGGHDRYVSGVLAQGAGNSNGIGILNDNGGDDAYLVRGQGQGRGNFDPARELGSFGLLFDTGGDDRYSPEAGNGTLSFKTQWGIRADTR